jgi:hypothetical protein
MAQWYKRLLDGALQSGVVTSFEGESHLSKLESFPPCILPAADIAEEHAFSAMRSTAARLRESGNQEGVDATVLQRLVSFKERFFVAHLVGPDSAPTRRLEVDNSPLHACPVVARRRDFINVCVRERLSFTTLESAKFASAFMLRRLIAHARSAPQVPTKESALGKMYDSKSMPDWTHSRGAHSPSLEGAMDAEASIPGPRPRSAPMPDAPVKFERANTPSVPQRGMPKMEDMSSSVMTLTMSDNMLLDGAQLVAEDGVLEPLGDLDDAELFADSLFST